MDKFLKELFKGIPLDKVKEFNPTVYDILTKDSYLRNIDSTSKEG